MLRAFFDESGTNPKVNKALVVGGFLGSVEEWERASDAWDECLHGHPSIEYYSHKEAQSLAGQFVRFNRTSADAKTLALADTISRFSIIGVCATVLYRWFVQRDAEAARGIMGTRVYDWGFLTATSGVLQYADVYDPGDEKVDFVFDARTELSACIGIYNEMKMNPFFLKSVMRRAGECSPGDDKQIAALQMADLLSWEFSKAGETRTKSAALNLIIEKNKIIHLPCLPPRQLPDTLRLQKFAAQVHAEAINFLRRTKENASDRFSSEKDVLKELNALKVHEAYYMLEQARVFSQLGADKDYQSFLREYLATMQDESEFENFDRTMHDLMNVSHDELKAELEAEQAAKKSKRKAKKKPSAGGHGDDKSD